MYYGLGAGMMPTATAVVADLIEIARNRQRHVGAGAAARHRALRRPASRWGIFARHTT
jgi:hypothetical protein